MVGTTSINEYNHYSSLEHQLSDNYYRTKIIKFYVLPYL